MASSCSNVRRHDAQIGRRTHSPAVFLTAASASAAPVAATALGRADQRPGDRHRGGRRDREYRRRVHRGAAGGQATGKSTVTRNMRPPRPDDRRPFALESRRHDGNVRAIAATAHRRLSRVASSRRPAVRRQITSPPSIPNTRQAPVRLGQHRPITPLALAVPGNTVWGWRQVHAGQWRFAPRLAAPSHHRPGDQRVFRVGRRPVKDLIRYPAESARGRRLAEEARRHGADVGRLHRPGHRRAPTVGAELPVPGDQRRGDALPPCTSPAGATGATWWRLIRSTAAVDWRGGTNGNAQAIT